MTHGVAQLLTEKDIMEIGTIFMMFQLIDSNIGVSAEDSAKTIAKRTLTVIQNRAKDKTAPDSEDNN